MRTVIALALVLACTAGAAPVARAEWARAADSTGQRRAFIDFDQPRRVPTALDSVSHPWPGVALILSTAGTALPVVLGGEANKRVHDRQIVLAVLAAEVVTPAAGHLYGRLPQRALRGMKVRVVGLGVVALGASMAGYWRNDYSSEITWGHLIGLGGATIMAGSALWDAITVPDDVERRNAQWLREHSTVGVRLLPARRAPALALSVRF